MLIVQQSGLQDGRRRQNWIRNSSMQGGVAGSPGTLPTNWQKNAPSVLTAAVAAVGVEDGMDTIDISVSGTVVTSDQVGIYFETSPGIPARPGQAWALSAYLKMVTGSAFAGINTLQLSFDEFDAANGYLATQSGTDQENTGPTTGLLSSQRFKETALYTQNASCASIVPYIFMFFYAPGIISFTFRIGAPQAEFGGRVGPRVRTVRAAVLQ